MGTIIAIVAAIGAVIFGAGWMLRRRARRRNPD
jgi:hypothetical protein